jgi:hypothetical protein
LLRFARNGVDGYRIPITCSKSSAPVPAATSP